MVLPILLICIYLLVVTLYLQYKWRHRRILEAASKLPCPPTLPLIGNAHLLVGDKSKLIKRFMQWAHQYNGLYCVWAGPIPFIFVSNPDDVKIILSNSGTLEKSQTYKFMRPYIGQGMISGHVPIWKKHRRMVTPAFHSSNIERILLNMNEVGRGIVTSLDQKINKSTIDPKDIIAKQTIKGTLRAGLYDGVLMMNEEELSNTKQVLDWFSQSTMTRMLNPAYYFDSVFKLCYWKKEKQIFTYFASIVNKLRQGLKQYKAAKGDYVPQYWLSLMDIWDANTTDTSDDPYWIDEFMTFMGAAADTTSSATYLLLGSLAANQDVQEKIYSEIKENIGSSKGDLTMKDLNSLTYLGHVITESMRLHGVVPFIGRLATKDTKLTNYTLPAGTNVYIHLHAMGWDPHVFPEPHRFNPDRFLMTNEQEYKTMMNRTIPFSAGPRNCIGKQYGIIHIKCVIVQILSKYKLTSAVKLEDMEYEVGFVTSTKHPFSITFCERQ